MVGMSSAWQIDTAVDASPRAVRPPPRATCSPGPPARQIYSRSNSEPTFVRSGESSIAERLDIIDGIHASLVLACDEDSPLCARAGTTSVLVRTGSLLATCLATDDHDETFPCQVMKHHPQSRAEHLRSAREQFVRDHEAEDVRDVFNVSPTPSSSMKDLCSLLHSSSLKQGTHFAMIHEENVEDKSSGSMSEGPEEEVSPEARRLRRVHASPPSLPLWSPSMRTSSSEQGNPEEWVEEAFEECRSPPRLRRPKSCASRSAPPFTVPPDGSTPQAVYQLRLG